MTQTVLCAEGNHSECRGQVTKWAASKDDIVLERPLLESDGVNYALVACRCSCHQHPSRFSERPQLAEVI